MFSVHLYLDDLENPLKQQFWRVEDFLMQTKQLLEFPATQLYANKGFQCIHDIDQPFMKVSEFSGKPLLNFE